MFHSRSQLCTNCSWLKSTAATREQWAVKCRPHYFLHYFTAQMVAIVYILPVANANVALQGLPEALARCGLGTCKRSTWLQRISATTDRPYRPPLFPTTASPDHMSSLLTPAYLPSWLQASGEPIYQEDPMDPSQPNAHKWFYACFEEPSNLPSCQTCTITTDVLLSVIRSVRRNLKRLKPRKPPGPLKAGISETAHTNCPGC